MYPFPWPLRPRIQFMTILPDNPLQEPDCRAPKTRVDTSKIQFGKGVWNLLEAGTTSVPARLSTTGNILPSHCQARPIDWEKAFRDVGWFHITGITLLFRRQQQSFPWKLLRKRKRGVTVSCDLNFRNLEIRKDGTEVMRELLICGCSYRKRGRLPKEPGNRGKRGC